jgi:hypothetical protein
VDVIDTTSSRPDARERPGLERPHHHFVEGVVAVIPAFDEERFIASVVLQTKPFAEHVIVVDDGSSDRTAHLAESAGAIVVRQPTNLGKAAALTAGFARAAELEPRVVVCLDGDSQHEPADIPSVARLILSGELDVVIGSRFLETRSAIPIWRKVGQHTLTAMTNGMSGTKLTDSQSGFRAFSPTAVEALRFTSQGLSVESEMQFLFGPAGLRVAEVPIRVRYQDGNKRNPFVHALQVIDAMITLVARRRPLAFFSLPGAVLVILGSLLGLHVTVTIAETRTLLVGSAILTALLLVSGLLLGITGIILHSVGHLIGRLRDEVHVAVQRATDLRVEGGLRLASEGD